MMLVNSGKARLFSKRYEITTAFFSGALTWAMCA